MIEIIREQDIALNVVLIDKMCMECGDVTVKSIPTLEIQHALNVQIHSLF
jgi:hypothetical protein